MNLLHLVSEQTVQNLLPLLAVRSDKVIQVQGAEPPEAARLSGWCRALGVEFVTGGEIIKAFGT